MTTRRKSILFAQLQSDYYGSSRSLLRMVSGLDRGAYRAVVVVSGNGSLKRNLEANGAKVIEVPHVGAVGRWNLLSWRVLWVPFEIMNATWRYLRIIRSERIDLVHSNTSIIIAAALAAKIARVPHVFHVREIYDEFPFLWRFHRSFIAWSSRAIICISTAVASQFPKENPEIIRNGFDLNAECRQLPPPEEKLSAPGLDGELLVGCVGRIKWRRKGQEVLIQALGRLRERGVRVNALFVGSPFPGNERHEVRLRQLAQRLGVAAQVSFLAERADMWPLYARMDVLVMPSVLPEPLGNVILEAMAMGVPVVSSRCGGTVDMIEDGRDGLLFQPGASDELADELEWLSSHPRELRDLGEAGRSRQRREFSLGQCVGRIDSVYRRVLDLPAGPVVEPG